MAFDNLDQGDYTTRLDLGPFVFTQDAVADAAAITIDFDGLTRTVSIINRTPSTSTSVLSVGFTAAGANQVADPIHGERTDIPLASGESVTVPVRVRRLYLQNNSGGGQTVNVTVVAVMHGTRSDSDTDYPLLTRANYGSGI